jgi:hypothetical protein
LPVRPYRVVRTRRYDARVNPLRRLLPGSGKVPVQLRAELAAEGLVLLEEGLRGSITYRDYRAPDRTASLSKVAFNGAIALTATRLVVWGSGARQVDTPLEGPLRSALTVTLEPPETLCFAVEAAAFDARKSGTVEVRLRSSAAPTILDLVGTHDSTA